VPSVSDTNEGLERPGVPARSEAGLLGGLTRRAFIKTGSITAAAVGLAGAVPGLAGVVTAGSAEAPEVESGAVQTEGAAGALAQPLVAQVKDLGTGEISLFQGEQELVIKDPGLARQLFTALHR
jgi:hypothetical protein